MAQALLAVVLWLLPNWWWVDAVASFNLLVLASNLLPWRVAGMASDGWWILAHLRRRGGGGPGLIGRRAVIGRILDFEGRARSPMGVWYAELMLAWTDLLVGRLVAADRFFAEAHDEAAIDPVLDALSQFVEASWHRARGRPLAALRLVRDVRRAYGSQLTQSSEDLLAVVEARTWLDLDEPDAARKALSQVAGAAGAVGGEAAVIRLEIALRDQDIEAIARCTRHLGHRWSGAVLDLPAAIRALSRGVEALGGPADVELGQLAAIANGAARRLLSQCDAPDRHSLASRLGLRPSSTNAGAGYG